MKVFHLTAVKNSLENETTFDTYSKITRRSSPVVIHAVLLNMYKDLSYKHVADIDCETLNKAYELTNSIDDHWSKNSEVTTMQEELKRSTSVGDLIMDNDDVLYIVDKFGFKKL